MPLLTLPHHEAFGNQRRPSAAWPRDPKQQAERLTPFCLPELQPTFRIEPGDLVFTIGSCFARNIEEHLIIEGFNVAVKAFPQICEAEGVKIKPNVLNKFVAPSILHELQWALEPGSEFPMDSIVAVTDSRYIDMQLAAGLMPTSLETMQGMRRAVSIYMKMVKDAKVIIMTLGLAEAWFDNELKLYLNTPPHRGTLERQPDRFEFHLLDYNDILSSLEKIIALLDAYGQPGYRILLTVSPVALGSTFTTSDAFIANTYSKSVQRAAVESIRRRYPQVDYMPSYESVTLSERRVAWREDCAHASDDAVRVNVLRMLNAYTPVGERVKGDTTAIVDRGLAIDVVKTATLNENAGDLVEAEKLMREAVRLAPDEVIVRTRAAQFFLRQGNHKDAAVELEAACSLGGRQKYKLAYPLARSLTALKQYDKAEDAFRTAVQDEPDRPGVKFGFAKLLVSRGNLADASVLFIQCLALQPDDDRFVRAYFSACTTDDEKSEAFQRVSAIIGRDRVLEIVRELETA